MVSIPQQRETKDSKAGLVFTLDEICITLQAMAHEGPLTDTTRVRIPLVFLIGQVYLPKYALFATQGVSPKRN